MAASSNLNRNYHVFLSFRGPDVRKNFLSHLYAALDEKGIHTFVDREELRIGEQISPALMRAIEESRVAIIIFSEDYASSPWCLEEVVKIMESHEQKGLIVFPVFYKVEPREVRRGRESYGRAMANHESKFGKDSEKVRRWKKALFDAGSLSGWNSNDSGEAELIRCIVKELSIHLNRTPLDVAKYPVGIDSRVQELISLSEKESSVDDVLMIGLWGPGGIGKTTTAKALYNAIERQFQGFSYLAQVRETSNQSNGLVTLQEQLLSEILFHKTVTVYSVDGGINLIRERLRCKKVLLVLDDVDQTAQLNALAGKRGWFGKGSRIIVTSRDKHLLTSHGINHVYEVQSLGYEEARNLFGRHAFPNGKRAEIRRDLMDRALRYANGLPLALEVLGSFLCGRNESAWQSALNTDCLEVDSSSWHNVADVSPLEKVPMTRRFAVCLRGREMPEWILHCKEGFVSFTVPRDLYDKFLGLALCAVLRPEEGKVSIGWGFELSVNGGRVLNDGTGFHRLESDNVWLYYLSRSSLDGVGELMRDDWSHFQVRFNRWDSTLKKCGFRLICEKQEDDLRVCTPTPSADAKEIGNLKERDSGKRQFSVDSEDEDSPVKWDSTKKMRWSEQGKTMGSQNMPLELDLFR